MFIIIRKNNTVLNTEPTEMDMYITGDALCRYKSLLVGVLRFGFISGCLCNGTIILFVGLRVLIYKSEEIFPRRTLWLSFSDWGLTFASCLSKKKKKNQSSWVWCTGNKSTAARLTNCEAFKTHLQWTCEPSHPDSSWAWLSSSLLAWVLQ